MTKPVIVNRVSKGAALTYEEQDANFTNLQNATITVTDGTNSKAIDLNGTIQFTAGTNVTLSVNSSTGAITINSAGGNPLTSDLNVNNHKIVNNVTNGNIWIKTNGSGGIILDTSSGGEINALGTLRLNGSSVIYDITGSLFINSGSGITTIFGSIQSQTPYQGKTFFNVALDSVVTVDNIKYRISNQGGIFPQVESNTGSALDVCWSIMGVVSGAGTTSNQNTGTLIPSNSWTTLYSSHGLDTRSDTLVAHITDKNAGKIYRVTFLVANNSSNTTGYNILVERII